MEISRFNLNKIRSTALRRAVVLLVLAAIAPIVVCAAVWDLIFGSVRGIWRGGAEACREVREGTVDIAGVVAGCWRR